MGEECLSPVLRIRIRDPGAFLTPGSGIRDPGSAIGFFRILDSTILKISPNLFLQHFINKIIFNFVKLMGIIKGMKTNFFSPLPFVAVFGSGIRDG